MRGQREGCETQSMGEERVSATFVCVCVAVCAFVRVECDVVERAEEEEGAKNGWRPRR